MPSRLLLSLLLLASLVPACATVEQSVKPGINDPFLGATDADIAEFVGIFEGESREIAAAQKGILAALDLKPGMAIADIGAGTGLYEPAFSKAVGADGVVYAVDLAPKMLEHLSRRVQVENLDNVQVRPCTETDCGLEPGSVDLVYICDTYHHFEYPMTTMESIRKALRPGGTLAIVDFDRIEGVSRPWILKHMRAGKEVFLKEIEDAGFVLVDEPVIEGLEENYLLLFRRP